MSREGGPSDGNIFVRFRQHVDSRIAAGIHTLIGYPSSAARSSNADIPSSSTLDPAVRSVSHRSMDTLKSRDVYIRGIFDLLTSRQYSPAALRHLPQPTPNDLPLDLDPSAFTFKDAFEDLLSTSQGRPLLDVKTRYEQSKLLAQMFPNGEPNSFWMRRLESQGLVQVPNWARNAQPRQPNWETLHHELRRQADNLWRSQESDQDDERNFRGAIDSYRGYIDDYLHEMRKEIEQLTSEATNRCVPPEVFPREPRSPAEQTQRALPDTFNELYSAISSAFAEGHKTWETFVKAIAPPPASSDLGRENQDAQGTRRVETRDEYTDRFGYTHTTVTRKILDEQGREVGRETSVVVRPAGQQPGDQSTNKAVADGTGDAQSPDKNAGWFWK